METGTATVSGKTDTVKVLNEDSYNTLNRMLSSTDEGDHKLAQLTLNQVDVQASIYYIWMLARKHVNRMVNLRTKASRAFSEEANLFRIAYYGPNEFAMFLEKQKWITPQLYMLVVRGIKHDLAKTHKHHFYDLHATLKDEYKDLDNTDTLTPLKDML